jgi:hypothetical protein
MSNRHKNSRRNSIPKKILPPDAVRVTKADKTRVWLIGGLEFDSKAEYFQYLVDKALAAQADEPVVSPTGADGSTTEKGSCFCAEGLYAVNPDGNCAHCKLPSRGG